MYWFMVKAPECGVPDACPKQQALQSWKLFSWELFEAGVKFWVKVFDACRKQLVFWHVAKQKNR
jgi:hypothetical protein